MRYLLLICDDPTAETYRPEDDNISDWVGENDRRHLSVIGDRLRPAQDARTVRVRSGQLLVTDGPFAETQESIAGFDVLECADSTRRSNERRRTRWPASAGSRSGPSGRWGCERRLLTAKNVDPSGPHRTDCAHRRADLHRQRHTLPSHTRGTPVTDETLTTNHPPADVGTGVRDRLAVRLLLISTFVVILNETIMGVALPRLMSDLDIPASTAQWVTTAFMLTMAIVIPVTGFVIQRFTTRAVFLAAMTLFSSAPRSARWRPGSTRSSSAAWCRRAARRSCSRCS